MVVKGVAHVHSTYSFDGKLSIRELADFFRERDINVVLMSEHVEGLDPEQVRAFISDCQSHSSGGLLLVPGIEIDALNALFFGVQPVGPWTSVEHLAQDLVRAGALAAVSHPVKVKNGIPKVTASFVEAVEVWNSRHDGKLVMDSRMVRFWLDLRNSLGRPLVPLCGIDFHDRDDFVPLVFELSCDRLDVVEVIAAIRAGSYCIVRSSIKVPLHCQTGELAPLYQLMSILYRGIYSAVYKTHRTARWLGLKPSTELRRALRRIF